MPAASVSTRVYPAGMLNTLSQREVERLQDVSRGELAELVRRCALAVLNSAAIRTMRARYSIPTVISAST